MMPTTPGGFLVPEELPPPPPPGDYGPVGIVVTRLEEAVEYLSVGAPRDGYVIIRTVNDVPARLGGLAILDPAALTPAMRDALTAATLGA